MQFQNREPVQSNRNNTRTNNFMNKGRLFTNSNNSNTNNNNNNTNNNTRNNWNNRNNNNNNDRSGDNFGNNLSNQSGQIMAFNAFAGTTVGSTVGTNQESNTFQMNFNQPRNQSNWKQKKRLFGNKEQRKDSVFSLQSNMDTLRFSNPNDQDRSPTNRNRCSFICPVVETNIFILFN